MTHTFIRSVSIATVPQGAWGGQIIRILHPDGSGREVEAQIPMGMTAGSTIYVKAGPSSTDSRPEKQPINDYSDVTPMPPPAKAGPPPFSQCLDEPNQSHPHMTSTPVAPLLEPSVNHSPFSNCLDSSDDQRESAYQSSYNSRTTNNGSKRLLKVTVPPNARPGTTIHIQAPGEDRLIAAQVPPDCSEFHVEYDEPSVGSRYTSSQQHFSSQSTPGHNNMHFRSNEKVLLVHVPPGVPAGSTLHVHIPNEPGRLLCAQVPPGNVRAFHVSYIAER
jgi:hypothetical protein